jgi:ATP-binding cassette subfamily C protein CydC
VNGPFGATTAAVTAPAVTSSSRWRSLLILLRPYRKMLALTIAFGVADQALALGAAGTGAYIVGRAATGASVSQLRVALVVLGILVVPKPVTGWLESFVAHDMAFRILVDLRVRLFSAVERLAPSYLLGERSGDLGATAMGDIELVELFFAHTLSPMVVATVIPAAALVALLFIDPLIAAALLPALLAVASVPLWLRHRSAAQGRDRRSAHGLLSAETVDRVQGLREVLVFGQQDAQLDRLDQASYGLGRAQAAHASRAGVERGLLDGLTAAGLLAVLAVTGTLVADHTVAASVFPLAVVLAGYSFAPLTTVLTTARELGSVAAAGDRILALLDARPPVGDPDGPGPAGPITPNVRFERATFRYGPQLPDAIRNITFDVPAGSTVALVGHSGAGKSTCAALLLRWWDPEKGQISLGGHDLRTFRQADLHRRVSLIPQDTYLFNLTVTDNIRLARPDATQTDVEQAATAALAHSFIVGSLPDGYNTIVGERGAQLSGGQRQRIAIARALLGDAPVLVLDEAVSNVDAESEAALETAMAAVRHGRTTLVIAHRHSTIRAANSIVLLDAGRVIDIGTDAELTARSSVYRQLLGIT